MVAVLTKKSKWKMPTFQEKLKTVIVLGMRVVLGWLRMAFTSVYDWLRSPGFSQIQKQRSLSTIRK